MTDWNYAEWAEKNGRENLRGRLATGDHLLQQANTLLTLILVAVAGMSAYGVKVFTSQALAADWGCAIAAAYLIAVAVMLTAKCIVTQETQVLFNEPANIYKPELKIDQTAALEYEMALLQDRITKTKLRNSTVAWWLDACRYAALITPAVFALASFLAGQ